jgi:hypothetical protein
MQNTKLVKLLRTFSTQEIKDFEKFISSPYFLRGRNPKPLWKILKKFCPEFNSPQFTKENVFRMVYPGKKYDKKSEHLLTVLISEMTLLAEKFLAIEAIQNNDAGYLMHKTLSESLINRNLRDLSHKLILKNIEYVKSTNSIIFLLREMTELLENLQGSFGYFRKFQNVRECSQKLTLYHYGQTLRHFGKQINDYLAFISVQSGIKPESIKLVEMAIKGFDPEIFEKECYDDGLGTKQLILNLYFCAKIQLSSSEEDIITAIEIYKKNYSMYKNDTPSFLFTRLYNICITKRMADIKFVSLTNNLIDFVIENGLVENYLYSHDWFRIIFQVKVDVLGYDELKTFVDNWFKNIRPDDCEIWHDYSYGWLSFKNNDYEKTLHYLSKYSTNYQQYNDTAIKLRIASLYSLGYIEEAIYSLDSYERHLRENKKVWGPIIEIGSKTLKSFRMLINYRINSKQDDENILERIIENTKNSSFHTWFKERAEELQPERTM